MNSELIKIFNGIINNIPQNLNYISPAELYESLSKNPETYFILDNRDKASFDAGHIQGSTNIFFRDLFKDDNLKQLPLDKTIVIVCWVGHTASQLLPMLTMLGFTVIGLKYGMGKSKIKDEVQKGWGELGLPVSKKNSNVSI